MGLITDLIISAASSAATEAVRDVALGATAITLDAAEKAADGASVVFSATKKGINKAGEIYRKLSIPATKKKINSLKGSCGSLLLINCPIKNDESETVIYNDKIEPILFVSRNGNDYVIKSNNDNVLVIFKGKRVFSNYIEVTLPDKTIYKIESNGPFSLNTALKMNNGMKIIKNSIIGDYEIYSGNTKISLLKHNFAPNITYALEVFDNSKQLESLLLTLAKILY